MSGKNGNIGVFWSVLAVVAFLGLLFFVLPGKGLEAAKALPTISIEVDHSGILEDVGSVDRLYDGAVVEMSDNVAYFLSANERKDKDIMTIRAVDDTKSSSKEKIKIVVDGGVKRESENGWIRLGNQEFPLGETKIMVTASNSAGEVSREITVRKVSVAERCQPYNGDFSKLVLSMRVYCGAWKDYTEKLENAGKPAQSRPSGASSGPHSSSGSACLHYEAGRCWDDLEEEAYARGRYDKHYGYYGGSYYESDDCDEVCRDILEDAYNQGYED